MKISKCTKNVTPCSDTESINTNVSPLREESTLIDSDVRQNDHKKAFTLAEVLITLGIIGVVAAMTIPTLIANTNSQKYRSRFKKTISTLSQAAKMSQAQYGFDYATATKCGSNGGIENPENSMTICALLNGTLTGITFYNKLTDIKMKDGKNYTVTVGPWFSVNSDRQDWKNYIAYTLSDGTIVGIPKRYATNDECSLPIGKQVTDNADQLSWCVGLIDVNGSSLPNKEVSCTSGSNSLSKNDCIVKNDAKHMTDIYPVRFHDSIVEPASAAARYVLKTAK